MRIEQKPHPIQPPNGGYGWVIVLSSGLAIGVLSSVTKSAGLVYVTVLNKYPHASKELVATMTTVVRGIMFLIGTFSINFAERYSYKLTIFIGGIIASAGLIMSAFVDSIGMLILTFGIITGIGTGLIHAPSVSIIGSYFTSKRSTAMGIMLCLSGTLIAIMPIILQFLMDFYGLQGAFLLWGGIMLQNCVFALLYRQPHWTEEINESNELLTSKENQNFFHQLISDLSLFKYLVFVLLLGNRIAFFINNVAVLVIIPDFIEEEAIEPISMDQSALLLSVLMFGDVISRGISGFILDCFPTRKTVIFLLSLLATACSTYIFQYTKTISSLVISCGVYGIVTGVNLVLTYLLVFDYFPNLGHKAHALQESITGVFLFLEGPIIGKLWIISENYNMCWDFLSLLLILSAIVWIFKTK